MNDHTYEIVTQLRPVKELPWSHNANEAFRRARWSFCKFPPQLINIFRVPVFADALYIFLTFAVMQNLRQIPSLICFETKDFSEAKRFSAD